MEERLSKSNGLSFASISAKGASAKEISLRVVADLFATAILREIARENSQLSDIQLDFPRDGSMCASTAKQAGEKTP